MQENVVLISFLVLFVLALVIIVRVFSTMTKYLRAKSAGFEPSFFDTIKLSSRCMTTDFFSLSKRINQIEATEILPLCEHTLAGGNLTNLLAAMTLLKKADINYSMDELLILNLSDYQIDEGILEYADNKEIDLMNILTKTGYNSTLKHIPVVD